MYKTTTYKYNNDMSGEVFRFQGSISGAEYAVACYPDLDDLDTAYELNSVYDHIVNSDHWARTETIEVMVVYPLIDIDLCDIGYYEPNNE